MIIKIGNIFESNAETLVNTVNCVGIMGKGIALDFKKKYPDMFKQYVDLCNQGKVYPGVPFYYHDLLGNSVINFPTKQHWRSPSRLSYIVEGLKWFNKNYGELGIKSIAFPPLGCGNGGLDWTLVGPLMYRWLKDLPIEIEIYAPFGTKNEQLTTEYLESNMINLPKDVLGAKCMQFNPNWYLILETINRLNSSKYVLHVGRTVLQKLCYILTLSGVDTGFIFSKGMYGPYCKEVEKTVTAFSNSNLIIEKTVGKMIEMRVNSNFKLDESQFTATDRVAVDKTVDLFSRIKNTGQAELFTTIIFADNALRPRKVLTSEEDILEYVVAWKPKWRDSKREELPNAIRMLAMLKWISPEYSESLHVSDEFLQ